MYFACVTSYKKRERVVSDLWQKADEARAFILKQKTITPSVAIIAGSGLSPLSGMVQNPLVIDYKDIPHFPLSSVEHHPAKLIIGTIEGADVLLFNGRFHSYEGHNARDIAFMVYVAKLLGVELLMTTNAAGALTNKAFGTIGLLTDQINRTGQTPLMGANDYRFGPRYPSMHEPYSKRLQELARRSAQDLSIEMTDQVYAGIIGPQTETPAEVHDLVRAGATIVGMSTVHETIAAVHCGMKVLGLSIVTDSVLSLGLPTKETTAKEQNNNEQKGSEPITPKAAKKAAQQTVNSMIQLIKKVLKNYV